MIIALAVLFAVAQASPPAPPTNRAPTNHSVPQNAKQNGAPSAPNAISPTVQQSASPNRKENAEPATSIESARQPTAISKLPPVSVARDWIDFVAVGIAFALFVIGAVGVCMAYRTLRAIYVQAHEMKKQRVVMSGQLTTMRNQLATMQSQTAHLEASVNVARDAAKVAQASVEAEINKTRARIRIVLEKINLTWIGSGFNSVTCWLTNYGPTPAFIDDFRGRFLEVHVAEEPIVPDYAQCRDILYAESLQPNGRTACIAIPLEPNATLTEDEVMSLRKQQAFVHFYGFVKYRDVFDRSRRQTIHMRWTMRWGGMVEGQIMEWWDPVGAPEENGDAEDDGGAKS